MRPNGTTRPDAGTPSTTTPASLTRQQNLDAAEAFRRDALAAEGPQRAHLLDLACGHYVDAGQRGMANWCDRHAKTARNTPPPAPELGTEFSCPTADDGIGWTVADDAQHRAANWIEQHRDDDDQADDPADLDAIETPTATEPDPIPAALEQLTYAACELGIRFTRATATAREAGYTGLALALATAANHCYHAAEAVALYDPKTDDDPRDEA